jgi:hypothetical protein
LNRIRISQFQLLLQLRGSVVASDCTRRSVRSLGRIRAREVDQALRRAQKPRVDRVESLFGTLVDFLPKCSGAGPQQCGERQTAPAWRSRTAILHGPARFSMFDPWRALRRAGEAERRDVLLEIEAVPFGDDQGNGDSANPKATSTPISTTAKPMPARRQARRPTATFA